MALLTELGRYEPAFRLSWSILAPSLPELRTEYGVLMSRSQDSLYLRFIGKAGAHECLGSFVKRGDGV